MSENPQIVAKVNDEEITVEEFQKHVNLRRWRKGLELHKSLRSMDRDTLEDYLRFGIELGFPNADEQAYGELVVPEVAGRWVLDSLIEDSLIRQYADQGLLTVSDPEREKALLDLLQQTDWLFPPLSVSLLDADEISRGVAQRPLAENRQSFFEGMRTIAGFDDIGIQQFLTMEALREKVKQQIVADVSKRPGHILVRHITVTTQDEASEIIQLLRHGMAFEALAQTHSTDTGTKGKGGDLGWNQREAFVPEFEAAIWADGVNIGDILGPIKTVYGYHIVEIQGREIRELSENEWRNSRDIKFGNWLYRLQQKSHVEILDYDLNVPQSPTIKELGLPQFRRDGEIDPDYLAQFGIKDQPPKYDGNDGSQEHPLLNPCTHQPFYTVTTNGAFCPADIIVNDQDVSSYFILFSVPENQETEEFDLDPNIRVGHQLAVVLDGKVLATSTLQNEWITDEQIGAQYKLENAKQLLFYSNTLPLPFPLSKKAINSTPQGTEIILSNTSGEQLEKSAANQIKGILAKRLESLNIETLSVRIKDGFVVVIVPANTVLDNIMDAITSRGLVELVEFNYCRKRMPIPGQYIVTGGPVYNAPLGFS